MNRLFTFIFLIICANQSFAQDNRIQEPIKNFDRLWSEFNDRYAFFELKNIDWNTIYEKYRPLINVNTTNDSLFTVSNKMINELKDGHVSLTQFEGNKIIRVSDDVNPSILLSKFPNTTKSSPNIYQFYKITKSTLKEKGFTDFKKSKSLKIHYSTSNDYGYLLVSSMEGFRFRELENFIDDAIKAFKEKKGVIIDIRINGGGMDRNSHKISGRFTNKKIIAYYKRERNKGTRTYSKLTTKYLNPSGKHQFTKPIILLTSDVTASAADVFALMLKELPYVTIVGDYTQGIFSDIYNFKLPNKWKGTLSHQQYLSTDMNNYEGIGVEPDLKLLNELRDFENGIDPLIIKAVQILNEKNNR